MPNFKSNIAKHFHEVYFGGNWTAASFIDAIDDVNYEEATKSIGDLNSIATLSYHIHYYVRTVLHFLEGNEFNSSDKESFIVTGIDNESEWNSFKTSVKLEGERFSIMLDKQPLSRLNEFFIKEEYGSIYRNYHGIIEHTHYHLGQINILKKLIRSV